MNARRLPVTAAVLTRNSGKTLRSALESLRDFDEVIVCDGNSTDGTLDIARSFGARIIQQDARFLDETGRLFDYGGVRNQTLDEASHEWFFFLDSDEYCGTGLVKAIAEVVAKRQYGAYWVNRTYIRSGVQIDCATTYPNRQVRFFSRRSANRFIKEIHERIELKQGVKPHILDGTLFVPLEYSPEEIRAKWRYQTEVDIKRLGSVSLPVFIKAAFNLSKVSLLYAMRHLRIFLLCRGVKMPFALEMERHVLHLRLIREYWRIMKFR